MAGKTVEASVLLSLVDRITGPINRIAARIATLGRAAGIERIGASFGNLGKRITNVATALGTASTRLGTFLGMVGLGAGGGIAILGNLTKSVADVGAELSESSFKLGIGVEALQEYRYAAKMNGIEQETLSKGMEKLGINAANAAAGNKAMASTFKGLGIAVTDAKGKMRSNEAILNDTFAALDRIEDPAKRNAAAFKLFGKSGVDLVKMLADGEDGLIGMREEARRTGHVMSKGAAGLGDEFGDNLDRLLTRLDGLRLFLGVQLLPLFNDIVTQTTEWVSANQGLIRSTITEWVEKLGGLIKELANPSSEIRVQFAKMADAVTGVLNAIKPLVDLVGGPGMAALIALGLYVGGPLIVALSGLGVAVAQLGVAFMSTPIGWVTAGLVAIGASVYVLIKKWDEFLAYWGGLWGRVTAAFESSWQEGVMALLTEFNPIVHIARGINAVIEYFTGVNLIESARAMLNTFGEGLAQKWSEIEAWAAGVAALVGDWFKVNLFDAGLAIVNSLWNGIKAKWDELVAWVQDSINGLSDWMPDWVKEQLGIKVTAKVMTEEEMTKKAKEAGQRAADNVPNAWLFASDEERKAADTAKANASAVAEAAELTRLREENAKLKAAQTVTMPGGGPATSEPQTVETNTVTTNQLVVPEPIVAHEAQNVDLSMDVGGITVNVQGMTKEEAQAVVAGALKKAASDRQAATLSALND